MLCDMHDSIINQSQINYQTCQRCLSWIVWLKVAILILFKPRDEVINIGRRVSRGSYAHRATLDFSERTKQKIIKPSFRMPRWDQWVHITLEHTVNSHSLLLRACSRWWCWCTIISCPNNWLVCLSDTVRFQGWQMRKLRTFRTLPRQDFLQTYLALFVTAAIPRVGGFLFPLLCERIQIPPMIYIHLNAHTDDFPRLLQTCCQIYRFYSRI